MLVFVLASFLFARKAQPVLDWKTGILWASPDPCNDTSPFYKETFLIVRDDIVYHLAHSVLIGRKPNVTERGTVKFDMALGDFYLQDEDGRVFKLAVVKKELDPNAQEHLKSGKPPCQP